MKRKNEIPLASLIFVFCSSLLLFALEPEYSKNEKWLKNTSVEMDLKIEPLSNNPDILKQQKNFSHFFQNKTVKHILEVTNKKPTKFKLDSIYSTEYTTLGMEKEKQFTEFNNKSFEIEILPQGDVRISPDDNTAKSLKELYKMEDEFVDLLPKENADKLTEGFTWQVDGSNFIRAFIRNIESVCAVSIDCTVDKIEKIEGDDILNVDLVINIRKNPKSEEGFFTDNLKGKFKYNLTKNKPVSISLNGEIYLLLLINQAVYDPKGEKAETQKVKLSGTLTAVVDYTITQE